MMSPSVGLSRNREFPWKVDLPCEVVARYFFPNFFSFCHGSGGFVDDMTKECRTSILRLLLDDSFFQ